MSLSGYTISSSDAIGIFDSGVGGLTVMQQMMQVLPAENLIYFGDTARVPYGNKSPETIIRYSIENAHFLSEKKIKLLVVACNTASAYALPALRAAFSFPVIGVIEAGAAAAVAATCNHHIAVIGTRATILSGAYQSSIYAHLPFATLLPIACPLFVPLVEEQWLVHPATQLIVRQYLGPLHHLNIDTLLLGCTHYPLLASLIQKEIGENVKLVDSATTCAKAVLELLSKEQLLNDSQQRGEYHYYVSDDPERFHSLAAQLLGGLEYQQMHILQRD